MSRKKVKDFFKNPKHRKIILIAVPLLVVSIMALTLHFLILPAATMEKMPICGLEEHQHDESCYREEKVLVCTLPEDENHTHTDECYVTQKVLVCGKKEHVHTAECFEKADPKADKESEKDWRKSTAKAKRTKNWANDIVEVALTQLDYKQSSKNFVWSEDGNKLGYTRYGDWFGNKYAKWNNMFVSFCLSYADIPSDLVPYKLPVSKWIEKLETNDAYEKADKSQPEKGDILFLDKDGDSKAESTAIVETVESEKKNIKIKAIEGDVKGKVQETEYKLKDEEVIGFGKLAKAQDKLRRSLKVEAQPYAGTKKGTYWKQVRSLNELKNNDSIMIVSVEGNYALTNNKGNTYNNNFTMVTLNPIKGNPDYYTVKGVPSTAVWKYRPNVIENAGYRLDLRYVDALFTTQAAGLNFGQSNTAGCWELSTYDSYYGYTYYLNMNAKSFFSSNYKYPLSGIYANAKPSDMLILKQVNTTLTIPDDPVPPEIGAQPGSALKPDYPAYIDTSGEVTGNGNLLGADFEYKSDSSTSQIESKFGYHVPGPGKLDFDAQKIDDGKTLTDKSVIYGKDDYSAFNNYGADEFSVTLSALGQTYKADTVEEQIPIDVLFVLDLSGSMNDIYGDESRPRAEILVDSMNSTIDNIMKANPQNRVCAVGYNSNVEELIPLGRPKKDSQNRYLKFIKRTSGEFYVEHQINVVDTNKTVTCQYGTYTQLGIAKGVEMMEKNRDTKVTVQVHGVPTEVSRKPVIILVSDGEPTHCTSHYMNVLNSPYYGDGIGDMPKSGGDDVENPKGILGYYTILSANYYKRMVGIHYDNPASMYTVAFGMDDKDTGHHGQSAATKHYWSTVMNPTPDNIKYLKTIVDRNLSGNKYSSQIEGQLYSLLNNTYKGGPVEVGVRFDLINHASPHINVPVILDNPYRPNYNYNDKAFLGNEGSKGLNEAFNQIIDANSIKVVEQTYETPNHKPIVISDYIGDGMQVNTAPILRINGKNYKPTGSSLRNGVKHYEYKYGLVDMDDYSDNKVNTNDIDVTLTTDSAGNQEIKLYIPDKSLPVYSVDGSMSFYYEALPIRLIYKVGLSQESKTQVEKLAPGTSLTFYTNSYEGSEHANSAFSPSSSNSYYKKNGWKQNVSKENNTTGTDAHSLIVNGKPQNVNHSLGNNGKLVFSKPGIKKTLSVEKKWLDYHGEDMTEKLPESITAILYRTYLDEEGKTVKEDVAEFTLNKENNWQKTFTDAELNEQPGREYKYYVSEDTLEGYKVSYEADGVSANTDETPIIITNRYKYGDVILPSTGGPGTVLITIVGAALVIFALGYGYVLIRRKRKTK